MRNDRIGMMIQKKKRTKNFIYSKAWSRAAFEELVVVGVMVATRDNPIG